MDYPKLNLFLATHDEDGKCLEYPCQWDHSYGGLVALAHNEGSKRMIRHFNKGFMRKNRALKAIKSGGYTESRDGYHVAIFELITDIRELCAGLDLDFDKIVEQTNPVRGE